MSEDLASHESAIRAYLAGRLRATEVEDAAQTVMQRALERLNTFRTAERPRAWLLGVARNVAYEALRARARSAAESPDPEEESSEQIAVPSPEARLDIIERNQQLYLALDGLKQEDQLALLLTYVDGLAGPRAAEIMGVSFAAFRQRLSRARRQAEHRLRELAAHPSRVNPVLVRAWAELLESSREPDEEPELP